MESDKERKSYVRQFFFSSIGLFIMLVCYTIIVMNRQSEEFLSNTVNINENEHVISTIYYYDMNDSMAGNYLSARYAKSINAFNRSAQFYQQGLNSDPENYDLLHKVFVSHLLSGDVDQAIDLISYNEGLVNSMLLAHMVYSVDKIKNGQYLEAEAVLMNMLREHSDELTSSDVILCSIMIAWTKVGSGNFREALGLLVTLASADNMENIWHYHMALINESQGLNDNARNAYAYVLEHNELQTYEYVKAAERFHRRIGEVKQAREIYSDYMQMVGYSYDYKSHFFNMDREKDGIDVPNVTVGVSEVILSVVRSLYEKGRYKEAIIYLHLARHLDPENEPANFLLGLSLVGNEMYEEANNYFSKVTGDKYLFHYSVLHIVNNLYHLGDADEAIRRLYNIADNTDKTSVKKDAMLLLADILRVEQRFRESTDVYDIVVNEGYVKDSEEEWRIYYNRAIGYEKQDKWEQAESDFIKSLELNPNQPDALNYLAYSWLLQDKNIETAKEMIEIAYQARPDDPYVIDSMGWALMKTGDYEGAVEYLERAVLLKPNDPVLHDHLGDVYWLTGRKNEARFQWNHAINFDEQNKYTQAIQDKIENGLDTTVIADIRKPNESYISLSQ
ncbi:MAG: tetratricopeptide repeat protein [Rickettsiales bacterium]|nr:tetratricopeptide repeat protein [Rickettsiales bacterium]